MWSTRNVIVASAWIEANAVPNAAPTSNPSTGPHGAAIPRSFVKTIAPQAPDTVPITMSPSRPMLTMPDRSLNSPPRPVR